jgi:HD superfamily phosphohydrolase
MILANQSSFPKKIGLTSFTTLHISATSGYQKIYFNKKERIYSKTLSKKLKFLLFYYYRISI